MSCNRLLGKRVLVTGGGSGIGRAICKLFAREGAEVAVMDIDKTGAEHTLGLMQDTERTKKHFVITGNVGNANDVKKTYETVCQTFGRTPNVLVNNAGIVRGGLIDAVSDENLEEVLNIDLKAVYLMSKYFIAAAKDSDENDKATIVNVASMAGKLGMIMNSDYATAKAGVIGLTKSIALEYQWHKVRCNALLPGVTDTPMVANADERIMKNMKHVIPMRRMGQPVEIANACLFLASEESSYIHGTCLEVAGGL